MRLLEDCDDSSPSNVFEETVYSSSPLKVKIYSVTTYSVTARSPAFALNWPLHALPSNRKRIIQQPLLFLCFGQAPTCMGCVRSVSHEDAEERGKVLHGDAELAGRPFGHAIISARNEGTRGLVFMFVNVRHVPLKLVGHGAHVPGCTAQLQGLEDPLLGEHLPRTPVNSENVRELAKRETE